MANCWVSWLLESWFHLNLKFLPSCSVFYCQTANGAMSWCGTGRLWLAAVWRSIGFCFLLTLSWTGSVRDTLVFDLAIPHVILPKQTWWLSSVPTIAEEQTGNQCWNSFWLTDSVTAASMLPSASYSTSTLFLLFPGVFGAGVCNDRVKAMPAMLKVKFKMAAQRTTALGGGGREGSEPSAVFDACKCLVFWSRRRTQELSRRLNLITNIFSFRAALEAWFIVRPFWTNHRAFLLSSRRVGGARESLVYIAA